LFFFKVFTIFLCFSSEWKTSPNARWSFSVFAEKTQQFDGRATKANFHGRQKNHGERKEASAGVEAGQKGGGIEENLNKRQ
jgi:hypothetical protein